MSLESGELLSTKSFSVPSMVTLATFLYRLEVPESFEAGKAALKKAVPGSEDTALHTTPRESLSRLLLLVIPHQF